jgi:hypothetical protein
MLKFMSDSFSPNIPALPPSNKLEIRKRRVMVPD